MKRYAYMADIEETNLDSSPVLTPLEEVFLSGIARRYLALESNEDNF